MSSYTQSLETLAVLDRDAREWCTGPILITIATSLSDNSDKVVDISKTIGHRKCAPRKGNRTDDNCY